MRLVAAPDGAVDEKDRALWLTLPFDLAWITVIAPVVITPDCRIYAISAEARSLMADLENRIQAIETEVRRWIVETETRALEIEAETRIQPVETDSRVLTVTCGV